MSSSNIELAPEDPLIGSRIDGRYTIFGVLGQGGMGVVYDGVHDELGRPVAIKVLNAAWASDRTAVERFLREARTASSFSHGNIVDVSDLGRLSDGRPYLVMPKIKGVDLATLLADNGPQPAKRVAMLLTGVAAALDLVHAKGYVHRDIKPENLMYIVREDGSETVMLLDFGIAAAMMTSGPRLTRQGAIFGTPQYLPPEVCTGGRPDARGDVYALAAVAFELITGMLLFPIEDIMQLMAAKVANEASTLSAATGAVFPPELEAVIACGLARNPAQRYSGAGLFIKALREVTDFAPVSWRVGVLRSALHSDEHALPPDALAHEWAHTPRPSAAALAVHGQGWNTAEPARYNGGPAYGSSGEQPYSRRRPGGVGAGVGVGDANYRPYEEATGSGRQQAQARSNQDVWAMHNQTHGGYRSEATEVNRLRMTDEHRYPSGSRERESKTPVVRYIALPVVGVLLAFGAVQLWDAQTSTATDAHANRNVAPNVAPALDTTSVAATKVQKPASNALRPHTPRPRSRADEAPNNDLAAAVPPSASVGTEPANTTSVAAATAAEAVNAEAANELVGAAPSETAVPVQPDTAAAAPVAAAASARNAGKHTGTRRGAAAEVPPEPPPEPALAEEAAVPPAAPAGAPPVMVLTPQAPAPVADAPAAEGVQAASLSRKASEALLRGEVSHAVELGRRATALDPDYALGWRTLGLALERSGASGAAVNAYEEYLRRAPTGPQSEMVRQRIQVLSSRR
ncbi:MAG: hypothetical protein RL701_3220 [Pseudomonadota bacterium]